MHPGATDRRRHVLGERQGIPIGRLNHLAANGSIQGVISRTGHRRQAHALKGPDFADQRLEPLWRQATGHPQAGLGEGRPGPLGRTVPGARRGHLKILRRQGRQGRTDSRQAGLQPGEGDVGIGALRCQAKGKAEPVGGAPFLGLTPRLEHGAPAGPTQLGGRRPRHQHGKHQQNANNRSWADQRTR